MELQGRALKSVYRPPTHPTSSLDRSMCHNIIDGRYHTECGHFYAMSTRLQDCLRPNCLFSRRHAHPIGCKSTSCIRLMALPVRNPIRLSPTTCSDCVTREREGTLGF